VNRTWVSYGIFFIAVIGLSWFYGLFNTMDRGPYSRHAWRQSDCLSITQNYYDRDAPFLEPEIHWLGENQDSKTISEFPIIYYTVAQIWKASGKHYWIYRLLDYLIFVIGLLYLFKLSRRLIHDRFWSLFVPLLFFTSPVIAYYANNFIMNVNALALAFVGMYHFFEHAKNGRHRSLVFGCLIFALAGLFKITALLFFVAYAGYLFFKVIRNKEGINGLKQFMPFIGTILVIVVWYNYAQGYNSEHTSVVFLQGILPIWELSSEDIANNWRLLHAELAPLVIHPITLIVSIGLFVIALIRKSGRGSIQMQLAGLLLIGIIAYFVLFFQVFNQHEYYMINLLIILPVIWIGFFKIFSESRLLHSWWMKTIGVLFIAFLAYSCAVQTRIKYSVSEKWVAESPLIDEETFGNWNWFHWDYGETNKHLENIEPYLEEIGITKNDTVLSIPDPSINISLYLMNRKGYTNFWYMEKPENRELVGKDRLLKPIEWGAKYIIVNNRAFWNDTNNRYLLQDSIGTFGNTRIYRVPDYLSPSSMSR